VSAMRDRGRPAGATGAGLAACLSLALAGLSSPGPAQEATVEGWRSFAGTWSVSGRRETVAVEGGRAAAIVEVSGAVVLATGEGLSRGFRGQAIGFDSGQGVSTGRAVWTDETGDRVFSRLKGESLGTGKRFVGTITGGTGRYAGLEGEYAFTWQYVVTGQDGEGVVQGRAVDLSGRVRRGGARE
jgi:hypothetical protein